MIMFTFGKHKTAKTVDNKTRTVHLKLTFDAPDYEQLTALAATCGYAGVDAMIIDMLGTAVAEVGYKATRVDDHDHAQAS